MQMQILILIQVLILNSKNSKIQFEKNQILKKMITKNLNRLQKGV